MVGTLLPFGLAASTLLNSYTVLKHLPDHVIESTRHTAPQPQQLGATGEIFTPAIDSFIRETIDFWDLHGLSIAIVRRRTDGSGGFDVATRGYGIAARDGRPVTADTLFPIGSNSKAFTATAVGHLVENSSVNLDWTSKVHQVLPEFQLQDEVASEYASLVDIFSHRTGLPRHDFILHDDGKPPQDFSLRMLKHLRPSTEFREATQYNNHMFGAGASLVANLTGVRFEDFVQEHIFDAAGMTSSTYKLLAAAAQGKLSEGFVRTGENTTYPGDDIATLPHRLIEQLVAGAGSIASSANDVSLWLQVLLNGGKSPRTGKQVIPATALQKMESGITVFSRPPGPELGPVVYGMALASSSYQGHQYIEHGGSLPGYLSQIHRLPNDGLGIAVLTNDAPRGQFAHEAIKWRIAEELLNMPLRVDWNTRYKSAYLASLMAVEEVAKARLPPPADAPPPSKQIVDLAGMYYHPAYGTLDAVVLKDVKNTLRVKLYDNVFVKSIDLTHYAGNLFNATLIIATPSLDSPSGEFEEQSPGVLAEFDFSEENGSILGFGVSAGGGIWGAGAGVPPPSGRTARERAEAWFERVDDSDRVARFAAQDDEIPPPQSVLAVF